MVPRLNTCRRDAGAPGGPLDQFEATEKNGGFDVGFGLARSRIIGDTFHVVGPTDGRSKLRARSGEGHH